MIALTDKGGGVPLYQIKITLKESKPPIWRRVLVRSDMPLPRFHNVIQIVMGWTDSHLHQFHAGENRYITPNPEFSDMADADELNEKDYTVADLAPAARKKFIYEYDFGDSWYHEVLVEKILPPDPRFRHPICLAGENACPPEDCGGIWGYYHKLEILNDPKNPAHEEIKEWMGDEWDPKCFDVEETNSVLKKMKA